MAEGIKALEAMIEIQGRDGNWDFDPYMHGMYNGMVLALHMMREATCDVPYREAPRKWGIHNPDAPTPPVFLDELAAMAKGSA